jgi:hypothetical protein
MRATILLSTERQCDLLDVLEAHDMLVNRHPIRLSPRLIGRMVVRLGRPTLSGVTLFVRSARGTALKSCGWSFPVQAVTSARCQELNFRGPNTGGPAEESASRQWRRTVA